MEADSLSLLKECLRSVGSGNQGALPCCVAEAFWFPFAYFRRDADKRLR
jgi:hypothetical protein